MASTPLQELYSSPNGDRWVLCRNGSGGLVVSHVPNSASGGQPSETSIEAFLKQRRTGPEYEALLEALAHLDRIDRGPEAQDAQEELSIEATEGLSRALGQAVARLWSRLPQEIQHDLFEAAVTSEGEAIRQQLAIYLHGKHARTVETLQTRAMPEPDSLGG